MLNRSRKAHRLALERWCAAYRDYLADAPDAVWRSHADLVSLTPAAETALEAVHAGTTGAPTESGQMGYGLANMMDYNERFRERMNKARESGSVVRTAGFQATFSMRDGGSSSRGDSTRTQPMREIAPEEATRRAFERTLNYVSDAMRRL